MSTVLKSYTILNINKNVFRFFKSSNIPKMRGSCGSNIVRWTHVERSTIVRIGEDSKTLDQFQFVISFATIHLCCIFCSRYRTDTSVPCEGASGASKYLICCHLKMLTSKDVSDHQIRKIRVPPIFSVFRVASRLKHFGIVFRLCSCVC